jgi:glycosyltransferase involved in cell wall biosynthesis
VKRTVLYVHANNEEIGGADYCLFKMAQEVRRHSWKPVVVLRVRTTIVDLYEEAGIKVNIEPSLVRLRKTSDPRVLIQYLVKFVLSIRSLRKLIATEKAHLVHANDLLDVAANIAARLAKRRACQHVRMIVDRPVWLSKVLTVLAANTAERVLCVSDAVKRQFGDAPNVSVLYDWIDMEMVGHASDSTSIRQELQLPASSRLIMCFGRLEPWKGQLLFLKAVDAVLGRDSSTHAMVVGGPTFGKESYATELTNQQQASAYRDRIHFLGHRSDIRSLMREADVVVHSSVAPDPLPGVVMEAMAQGCIVVGAKAGGVIEEIPVRAGYLFEPGNVSDLAEKMLLALGTDSRPAMAAAARAHVATTFSKDVLVPQLIDIYQEMAATRP